jgi:hypothetical protein
MRDPDKLDFTTCGPNHWQVPMTGGVIGRHFAFTVQTMQWILNEGYPAVAEWQGTFEQWEQLRDAAFYLRRDFPETRTVAEFYRKVFEVGTKELLRTHQGVTPEQVTWEWFKSIHYGLINMPLEQRRPIIDQLASLIHDVRCEDWLNQLAFERNPGDELVQSLWKKHFGWE